MNILFFDQYGSLGGGQQMLLEFVRAVQNLKFKVSALLPKGDCTVALKRMGVDVSYSGKCNLNHGKKNYLDVIKLLFFSISSLLKHRKLFKHPDILCANGGRTYLLCFLAAIIYKKPAIYYIHIHLSRMEYSLLRCILRSKYTKNIVAPSFFIQQCLLQHSVDFSDERVVVLENGLDRRFNNIDYIDRFSNNKIEHIGIVGHIHYLKGQDVLLPLAQKFSHLQFHILGEAAPLEQKYYDELCNAAPKNIHFHGWVHDLPAKVNSIGLQLCIIPSRNFNDDPSRCFEAFSLVSIEMSLLSCLVIPRYIGALADQVKNLELFSFEHDDELVELVQKILSMQSSELANITKHSYNKVMGKYSQQAFQNRLQSFFSDVASSI